MDELTAETVRHLNEEELYRVLGREEDEVYHGLISDEIARREMEGLPRLVAEAIADRVASGELDASGQAWKVVFTVTTDYDDGPAWDTHALLSVLYPGALTVNVGGMDTPVARMEPATPFDFARTTVADALAELSEHARPYPGYTLVVDLEERTAQVQRD